MPVSYRPSLGAAWIAAAGSPSYRLGHGEALPPLPRGITGPHAAMALLAGSPIAPAVAIRLTPRP